MKEYETKREDRRSIYTKEQIKKAFLRLKRHKEFHAITVADLCRECEISRGTFYLHYSNLAEVLETVLEDAMLQTRGLLEHLSMKDPAQNCKAYPFCKFIRESIEYHCIFTEDALTTFIINKIASLVKNDFVRQMMQITNLTQPQVDALFYFQMNGCLALSKRNRNTSEEQWCCMQGTVDDFLRYGFQGFMKQKDAE